MNFNQKALIHGAGNFQRETLLKRKELLGFNSLDRMELFLLDLEIFLQIQEILKEKIILKGGAAAQFYLPIEYQRSSVDIDMICLAKDREIKDALIEIEEKLKGEGSLFKFRRHFPQKLKTKLPLLTFYMDVPTACTDKELFGNYAGVREIKIEFFISDDPHGFEIIKSPRLFAMQTDKSYQIMPLNVLFADKLTTLGPSTIGVSNDRMDEQIKHIYDLDSLLKFKRDLFDFNKIMEYFFYRAKLEAHQRSIDYNLHRITGDMLFQLGRISLIDIQSQNEFIKIINDFQSLYLRKSITKPLSEWSVIGKRISLIIRLLSSSLQADKIIRRIFNAEKLLSFQQITGEKAGELKIKFKKDFIEKFKHYSSLPPEILKGKNPVRIFWGVISIENHAEICSWVRKFFK